MDPILKKHCSLHLQIYQMRLIGFLSSPYLKYLNCPQHLNELSMFSGSFLMNCPNTQGLSTEPVLPASIKLLVLCQMSQNTAGINTPSTSMGPMAPKIWHSNIAHMDCNAISLRPKAALPLHCYRLSRSRDRF